MQNNFAAIRAVLEAAGVEFIAENGGGWGAAEEAEGRLIGEAVVWAMMALHPLWPASSAVIA
jgi:hypothetical protein